MNKELLIGIVLVSIVLVSGCTTTSNTGVSGEFTSAMNDYELDVLVTDEFEIRRNTLFSDEITRLTLNLINLAEVDFTNVIVKLINADDLNPTSSYTQADIIEFNHSEKFEWELTAPRLGFGEVLVLNNILVRSYYDTYATAQKSILLKEPGDRGYVSTFESSSRSPLRVYFDTSFETVTTSEEGKEFTVNLVFFNNYSGVIDYYDNTNIQDNYIKNLVIGVDKLLTFNNYEDANTPWIKVDETTSQEALDELGVLVSDMSLKNYYYLNYSTFESLGYDFCSGMTLSQDTSSLLTQQRRMLWMTSGYSKVNVLRFTAPLVEEDTEVLLNARMIYSYSQDYGGEGFGVIVYGTG